MNVFSFPTRRRVALAVFALTLGGLGAIPASGQDGSADDDAGRIDVDGLSERIVPLESRIVALEARIVDVSPAPTPEGVAVPSDVLFAFGSAELTADARVALDEVVATLADAPAGTVTVVGHTDSIGDDASNQTLSEQRAAAVRAYLEPAVGRSDLTFDVQGRGESEPVAPNQTGGQDNPDGRRQNRRVEITVPGV